MSLNNISTRLNYDNFHYEFENWYLFLFLISDFYGLINEYIMWV